MFAASARAALAAEQEKNAALTAQLTAIDRAYAVIEFDVDGTIVDANANFLAVTGYRLDEVRGRHHSMFVTEENASSSEYRRFWERLRAGEFVEDEFLRYGKGGKKVWIRASYNPIKDEHGKVTKVIKYAAEVSGSKRKAADYEGQIEAVRRALAYIEFKPDGTIIDANDNFLSLMGYTREQIVGQHHRMFVHASEHNSPEYRTFWEQLRGGQFRADEFRRVTSSGSEVWLQASYNPIRDQNGRFTKIVKYATDITNQVVVRAELQRAMDETSRVMKALASGRLTERVEGEFSGDFKQLKDDINGSMEKMHELFIGLVRAATGVETGAQEISKGNADLSRRSEEAASSLEETASSMEEMTATVKQNADNAQKANELVKKASNQAEEGGRVVREAVSAMEGVNESSRQISDIIGVIDEIAFQTNLLALNASVEAARAGEQGRGFAVVASEVRNLAGRSATAAKEIKDLIMDSSQRVEQGSKLVDKSGKTLADIVAAVQSVTEIVGEIAAASAEQASGINEVNNSVTQMDELTQQNAALVEQIAAASESLTKQAEGMKQMIGHFDTDELAGVVSPTADYDGIERRSSARPWAEAEAANADNALPPARAVNADDDLDWQEF